MFAVTNQDQRVFANTNHPRKTPADFLRKTANVEFPEFDLFVAIQSATKQKPLTTALALYQQSAFKICVLVFVLF